MLRTRTTSCSMLPSAPSGKGPARPDDRFMRAADPLPPDIERADERHDSQPSQHFKEIPMWSNHPYVAQTCAISSRSLRQVSQRTRSCRRQTHPATPTHQDVTHRASPVRRKAVRWTGNGPDQAPNSRIATWHRAGARDRGAALSASLWVGPGRPKRRRQGSKSTQCAPFCRRCHGTHRRHRRRREGRSGRCSSTANTRRTACTADRRFAVTRSTAPP